MKIAMFYASWEKFGEPWSTPRGVLWELEARGHQIQHYNLYHADGDFLPKQKIRTYSSDCFNKFMFDFRNGYKPDVAFVMDYGVFDCMQMDKQYFPGVKFVLEAGDTPQSFRMNALKVHKFHSVITPDYQSAMLFEKCNVKSYWMTHWADQRIFHPYPEIQEQFDCVTTCGSRGGGLTEDIKNALGEKFNNERYFFGEDHARRLCMGKIVFQCSQFKEVTRRIFEGMACGKMMLTDRLPQETKLQEIFVDGQDIVYYDNAQDAIDKIRYFISHNDERQAIAINGYNKVMQQHTTKQRIDQLETIIEEIIL
jgi:Glycosyl transferases group 1